MKLHCQTSEMPEALLLLAELFILLLSDKVKMFYTLKRRIKMQFFYAISWKYGASGRMIRIRILNIADLRQKSYRKLTLHGFLIRSISSIRSV